MRACKYYTIKTINNKSSCKVMSLCGKRTLFTTFHQLEVMLENYHILMSFPACYASVMKRNINSVTLISKKDITRKMKMLFKLKFQVALHSLQLYQKGTFCSLFFLRIFRVTALLSKCLKNILKEYTAISAFIEYY